MKRFFKRIYNIFVNLGIDFRKFLMSMKGLPAYIKSYFAFRKSGSNNKNDFEHRIFFPCLADRYESSGTAKGHYFHTDLLIAKKIFTANPQKHVDIGSRIDGFIAHVASFREIEVFDIRELKSSEPNIIFKRHDFTNINPELKEYCDSISSLHAIEHFGLGRYGDEPDANGHLKGLANIYSILKSGGIFYFAVPIGPQRIEFNAHRVFSLQYLLNYFEGKYRIKSFAFINDNGELFETETMTEEMIVSNCNCFYGCGIFELIKL